MNNTAIAAIPIAIALLAGIVTTPTEGLQSSRLRLAKTAQVLEFAPLTDQEEAWLDEHNPHGRPAPQLPGYWTIVVREGYSLGHNNMDRIADWVSFRLTKAFANGTETRPGSSTFKADDKLLAGNRAELTDYKGWQFTYDRGHQCAAGDSKGRGKKVSKESFFLSNMTPQSSSLNSGKWKVLEMKIQEWARTSGDLFVITGPVFKDDDGDGIVRYDVLGKNQVAVPTHYYKIVYRENESGGLDSLCFLIPNEKIEDPYVDYLTSIDEIETLTALDFLAGLPDAQENELERNIADKLWDE